MKRLIWADSLKGILIVLVVFGHAIQYTVGGGCYTNHLWNEIYSFHMPAFMAVSGYFAYRGGGRFHVKNAIWRRFQQLLIPYLLWTILFIATSDELSFSHIKDVLLYPDKGLWFLWALFFISAIFTLCGWLGEKIKVNQEFVVLIVGLMLAASMILSKTSLFAIQFIAYYFIFYAAAFYFHKYKDKLPPIEGKHLISMTVIWSVMAWYWHMHKTPVFLLWIPLPATIVNYVYRFLTAAIAIYVLFESAPKILDNDKSWNIPFAQVGKLSLGIYTVHMIIIGRIVSLFKGIELSVNSIVIMSFLTALVVSCLIVLLLSKWSVTEKLFLGKV